MTITIYGIKNCDAMRKARGWLDEHGVAYTFHNYKVLGLDRAKLAKWIQQVGWEALLNRVGTTFRRLADADKQGLDQTKAIGLMLAQPSMIRRPIVEDHGDALLIGFSHAIYQTRFNR